MNFSLNEEQLSLQETVKKFAQNELTEIAKKMEQEDKSADKYLAIVSIKGNTAQADKLRIIALIK